MVAVAATAAAAATDDDDDGWMMMKIIRILTSEYKRANATGRVQIEADRFSQKGFGGIGTRWGKG
jgi:hypothetical protein